MNVENGGTLHRAIESDPEKAAIEEDLGKYISQTMELYLKIKIGDADPVQVQAEIASLKKKMEEVKQQPAYQEWQKEYQKAWERAFQLDKE